MECFCELYLQTNEILTYQPAIQPLLNMNKYVHQGRILKAHWSFGDLPLYSIGLYTG